LADIFVSYGRSTEAQAHEVAEALRSVGYNVWRDDAPGFRQVCHSLDHFLITLCLQEAVMGAATLAGRIGDGSDRLPEGDRAENQPERGEQDCYGSVRSRHSRMATSRCL